MSNNSSNHKSSEPEYKFSEILAGKSSDWHQRMADLVGFEDEIPPSDEESRLPPQASSTQANTDESSPSHPSSARTQQTLSSNPFAKVALVGGGTLLVVMVAGVFLSQLMGGTNQQVQKPLPEPNPNDTNQANEIEEAKPEEEIEMLKTKLAIAEQAKAVKAAQLQLRNVRPTPSRVTRSTPVQVRPQPETRVVVQRVPTPAPTVYVPRVVTVERVVRVPQQVAQAQPPVIPAPPPPQPTLQPSPSPTFELSTPELTPIPTPSTVADALSQINTPTPPAPPPTPPVNPRFRPTPQTSEDVATANPPTRPSTLSQSNQSGGKSLAVGTNAKAVLATALFGEANRAGTDSNNKNDYTFVVRLKEPLKSTDDAVVIPKDTELVTQIQRISETGMVQLTVVSIISREKSGNLKETTLPQGAMKIRAPKGRPLLARKYPNSSGKIAGMDTGLFFLGGVGKTAEILNRPETRIRDCGDRIDGDGRYLCTVTEQQRNIPAGILEGGMNSLVPQLTQRNQQAINEMITKNNVWFLPVGTEVEVFVNQIMKV